MEKRTYLDSLIEDLDGRRLREEKASDFIAFIECLIDVYSGAVILTGDKAFNEEMSKPYVVEFADALHNYVLVRTKFAIKECLKKAEKIIEREDFKK